MCKCRTSVLRLFHQIEPGFSNINTTQLLKNNIILTKTKIDFWKFQTNFCASILVQSSIWKLNKIGWVAVVELALHCTQRQQHKYFQTHFLGSEKVPQNGHFHWKFIILLYDFTFSIHCIGDKVKININFINKIMLAWIGMKIHCS